MLFQFLLVVFLLGNTFWSLGRLNWCSRRAYVSATMAHRPLMYVALRHRRFLCIPLAVLFKKNFAWVVQKWMCIGSLLHRRAAYPPAGTASWRFWSHSRHVTYSTFWSLSCCHFPTTTNTHCFAAHGALAPLRPTGPVAEPAGGQDATPVLALILAARSEPATLLVWRCGR